MVRCDSVVAILSLLCVLECANNSLETIDPKYHLVTQTYTMAKNVFNQGRTNYNRLRNSSLHSIDTFLDLVEMMNTEMARELRSAVVKFYKIKYFYDFTNYVISLDKMIDITEHCLIEPVEKLIQIREQFHHVIKNFEDVRRFSIVDECRKQLPDEVAVTHCILHQAVLFNETMQESLLTIVEIKTRGHAQDMNTSLYSVKPCIQNFVPNFFDQLLLDAYTNSSGYLGVVNACMSDLVKDGCRGNATVFSDKWGPLVRLLKERSEPARQTLGGPLFLTLLAANLSSLNVFKTLY